MRKTTAPGSNMSQPGEPAQPAAPQSVVWTVEASQADREAFLNQLGEGVIIANVDGRIVFVNEAAKILHGQALLGVAPDGYSASYHLFTMEGEPFPIEDLPLTRAVRHGEVTVDTRWRIRRADGSEVLAIGNARPMYDTDGVQIASILNIRDDTQRHADEVALKELVRAKDMLLHEVNHRVMNSLQLVTSLLTLQAARADAAAARQGLIDASQRIAVIARIHRRLYAASEHDAIDIGELLRDLVRDNVAAHSPDGRISFEADCTAFKVPLDQAVPLALSVTELATNAMKYAFAERAAGVIRLSVQLAPGDRIIIRIADDGIGLPGGFDPAHSTGMGMRIVLALVGQLRARFDVESSPAGTCFTIDCQQDGASAGRPATD
jgi:PAS domain S-box-containing protein